MTPSTLSSHSPASNRALHVALIMDGNGRWAIRRGLPRSRGHIAGAEALHRAIEAAPGLGIRNLTVYAFSADNWKRPEAERAALFALMGDYLQNETHRCVAEGVELLFIGWRHRLPSQLRNAMADAERRTAGGRGLTLRIALDYSSRDALAQASALTDGPAASPPSPVSRQMIDYALAVVYGQPGRRLPPVDLLIRTGGQQRLSDFLLWESAYAELFFTSTLWPDFEPADLESALASFHARNRTFGATTTPVSEDFHLTAGARQ